MLNPSKITIRTGLLNVPKDFLNIVIVNKCKLVETLEPLAAGESGQH